MNSKRSSKIINDLVYFVKFSVNFVSSDLVVEKGFKGFYKKNLSEKRRITKKNPQKKKKFLLNFDVP